MLLRNPDVWGRSLRATLPVLALAFALPCACTDTTGSTSVDGTAPSDVASADAEVAVDEPQRDAGQAPEAGADVPVRFDATPEDAPRDALPPPDVGVVADVAPPDDVPDALVCGGLALCAGVCRDLVADLRNCGACGVVCAPTQECVRGACVMAPCIGGLVACGAECFDLRTDREHCGGCDCECPAGTLCASGFCAAGCPAGLTSCSTARADGCTTAVSCRDLRFDRGNCGLCGHACAVGETCSEGTCTHPPPSDGGVSDVASDVAPDAD